MRRLFLGFLLGMLELSTADLLLAQESLRLADSRLGDAADGRGDRVAAYASVAFGSSTSWVDASGTRASIDSTLISPSLGLRIALAESLDVSLDWVLAYGLVGARGVFEDRSMEIPFDRRAERTEAGNPTLGLNFHRQWSILALEVGARAAFPVAALAQSPHDLESAIERAASVGMHRSMLGIYGAIDPWRFFPERMSFVAPLRIAVGDRLGGAVEIAPGVGVPVLGGSGDLQGFVQVVGELASAPFDWLRFGLRGSVVAWQLGSAEELVQSSLEPFVRVALGQGHLVARGTFPIGGPSGLDRTTPAWAIHIGGGIRWDRDSLH